MQVQGVDQNLPIDTTEILAKLQADLVEVGDLAPDGTDLTRFDDEPAAGTGTAQPQPSNVTAPAAPATTAAPAAAPAAPNATAAPAPQEERSAAELRQALRASRRAEQRAREELEELRQRAAATAPAPGATPQAAPVATEGYTEEELRELEIENPTMARILRRQQQQEAELAELRQRASATGTTAAAPPAPEFIPPPQDPAVQEAIDSIPQLLAWQINPDQTAFIAAAHADSMLRALPAWKDRPQAERLAEATRLAAQQLGATPSNAPATRAPLNVNGIPVRESAGGISDFGGGSGPTTIQPNYENMTVEQILAAIPESS